jgi:putative phosphoserine phosphatase / 1-acylglycerol-3-phosphate O-acyltransferase
VAGRNAAKLNPGTVDIAVLPPVSVENWTLRNLRERMEQVRAAYLATLTEWPAGTVATLELARIGAICGDSACLETAQAQVP